MLTEIRFLMAVEDPSAGLPGILQRSIATLLVVTTDGASQLLLPGRGISEGQRFRTFVADNFPWDLIEMNRESAIEYLWTHARCSLVHRLGLFAAKGSKRKYGRGPNTDKTLMRLERSLVAPGPFIEQDSARTVIWVEPLYWALRRAVASAVDTPEKAQAVSAHVESGAWDRHRNAPSDGSGKT
jgi:hypothetical protein